MKTKKSETKVMTKQDITTFLKKTLTAVANKNADLAKQVDYALTHLRKATKTDLEELLAEVKICLATPVAENQAKPKILEEEEVDSEVVVDGEDDDEEVVKEKPKKKIKKSTKAKSSVVEASPVSKAMLPVAKLFPKVINHDDLGKLVAVPNKYHTYKELYEALENGKTLYFACYWTARHIKEYDYSGTRLVPAPKKFPHDLDLLVACVPCEKIERVWCMSQYTEAMFMFEGDAFEPVEDEDFHTGEKFKIRVSKGMEFEIYESADEE